VPRFYFDCHEGQSVIQDDTGVDLRDAMAAESEAVVSAVGIARDCLADGDAHEIAIVVRDGLGIRLVTVSVVIKVDRHGLQRAS
jgi:hypothetical protein